MATRANAKVDMSNFFVACPTRKIKAGEPLIALLQRDGSAIHQ
ncbi:hypothetical protein [Acidiphilium sp. MT5]